MFYVTFYLDRFPSSNSSHDIMTYYISPFFPHLQPTIQYIFLCTILYVCVLVSMTSVSFVGCLDGWLCHSKEKRWQDKT